MEINIQNFGSIQEVLADVLVMVDDETQSKLTPGFYVAQVKNALDELGFDIPFLEATTDIKMPSDLIVDMPKGCFNLNKIHIYTGTPDNVGYVENVYWKKGAQTRGKGTGYTADVHHWNVTDPFFRVSINEYSKFYFSIQNGIIRLSDACAIYDYVRFTFNGIPSKNLDTIKMIPPEVKQAVILWVTKRCLSILVGKNRDLMAILQLTIRDLDEFGLTGCWHNAKMRLKELDVKMLNDIIIYNSKLNE